MTILLCFFFLFLVIFKTFFIIPDAKENTRVKPTLAIPAGTPVTLPKEITDTLPLAALAADLEYQTETDLLNLR